MSDAIPMRGSADRLAAGDCASTAHRSGLGTPLARPSHVGAEPASFRDWPDEARPDTMQSRCTGSVDPDARGLILGRYPRPRPETLLGWLERLDRSDGHWIWPGGLSGGYAHVTYRVDGRAKKVDAKLHVLLYEIFVGPVAPGLLLDHKCRRRPCCNPDCLEPVTNQVNVIRGVHGRAREAAIEAGQIELAVAA